MGRINRVTFFAGFIFLFLQGFSQFAWEKYYGGSEFDVAKKVLQTSDGNLVILAEESSSNGVAGYNSGGRDLVIFKCTQEGDILWSNRLGGTGNEEIGDFILTSDGGFAVVGTTDSPEGDIKTRGGEMDLFLAKLSKEGVLEWTKSYGGGNNDRGFCVLEMYDKGFLLGGETGSRDGTMQMQPLGGIDGWIARLDNKGKLIWERRYGGAAIDKVNKIIELSPNEIRHDYRILATSMSKDNHVPDNFGKQDIWVFNIDEYGRLVGWNRVYGGEEDEEAQNCFFNNQDSTLTLAGTSFSQTGNFSNQQGIGDIWLFQMDKVGDVIFSELYGGTKQEGATGLIKTRDAGFLLTGMTQSKDGDIGPTKGGYDGYLLKTDAKGKKKWLKTTGYEKKDFLYASTEAANGGYLSVGTSELTNNAAQLMEHNGKYDIWLTCFKDSARKESTIPVLAGNVIDKTTRKPMKVYIKLINSENLDSLQSVSTNPDNGEYLMVLPQKGNVSFVTLKPGYLFYGGDLNLEILASKPNPVVRRNIEMEPITQGMTVNLHKVFFNSADARPAAESYSEMERLTTFMRINPNVKITLYGYASFQDDGTDKGNLSLNRAISIKSYLVKRGIREERIQTAAGDINKQLFLDTGAEAQRKNRRVEFTVTSM